MSTIRKAYMEISNGIRGLRFHRDQSPTGTSQNDSHCSVTGSGKGLNNDEHVNKVNSSPTKSSKNAVHSEEGPVSTAMSRLFPNKSSTSSSPSNLSTFKGGDHSRTSENRLNSNSHSSSVSASSHSHSSSSSSVSSSSTQTMCSVLSSSKDENSIHNKHNHTNAHVNHQQTNGDCVNGRVRKLSKDSVFTQTKLIGSPKAGIASRIRKLNLSMTGQKWGVKPETIQELMMDEGFLGHFFFYFTPEERRKLCQVCKKWKAVLYQSVYWVGVTPVIRFKEWGSDAAKRKLCYDNFQQRGFEHVCLVGATDKDIADFVTNMPACKRNIRAVKVRCSNLTDNALETLIRRIPNMNSLELSNCNEITGSGLWACLNPKIICLTITDCIHIADDTIGAIAQLLPSLHELNLQAYHVTDNGLALFDSKLNSSLRVLRLKSCWEITNHGVVNIIHALPNVTVLSLSGCSKVTDDGIEIIAENMKKLKSLDISWCARVTDSSLEYIACDLGILEELVLDRCNHVTDIGIGYISTMTSLTRLFIRWCIQVGDFGLHHIFSMRNLRTLSIAGCRRLTSNGLYGLRHLQRLQELEVTNCPGANSSVCRYLKDNMPHTMIIE